MLAQNLLTKEKKCPEFFDTWIIAGFSSQAGSQARPARVALQWLVPGTFEQVLRCIWPSIIRFFWPNIKIHLSKEVLWNHRKLFRRCDVRRPPQCSHIPCAPGETTLSLEDTLIYHQPENSIMCKASPWVNAPWMRAGSFSPASGRQQFPTNFLSLHCETAWNK